MNPERVSCSGFIFVAPEQLAPVVTGAFFCCRAVKRDAEEDWAGKRSGLFIFDFPAVLISLCSFSARRNYNSEN